MTSTKAVSAKARVVCNRWSKGEEVGPRYRLRHSRAAHGGSDRGRSSATTGRTHRLGTLGECAGSIPASSLMKTLDELQRVAEIRQALESELAQARADAAKLIKQAKHDDVPITEIAKAAGISRLTVYETLKR